MKKTTLVTNFNNFFNKETVVIPKIKTSGEVLREILKEVSDEEKANEEKNKYLRVRTTVKPNLSNNDGFSLKKENKF